MNFYEWIIENIKADEKKYNCPGFICFNPKKEKELKGKTFEQVKEEASQYGLYLTWNDNYHICSDTHTYIFSLSPLDEHGLPTNQTFFNHS